MASILQGRGREERRSEPGRPGEGEAGEARSTLVSHGDGTHHIEHEDGSTTEHEHIGHALMHLAGKHSEGIHHHTHSDGMGGGYTTHHAMHGGEPEGPNEHDDMDSVHDGMREVFGDEGGEDAAPKAEMRGESKDYD